MQFKKFGQLMIGATLGLASLHSHADDMGTFMIMNSLLQSTIDDSHKNKEAQAASTKPAMSKNQNDGNNDSNSHSNSDSHTKDGIIVLLSIGLAVAGYKILSDRKAHNRI
jgi:hypothetical protein